MKRFLLVLALGLILTWSVSVDIGARSYCPVPVENEDSDPGGDDHGWGGENSGPGSGGTLGASIAPVPQPTVVPLDILWNTWLYDRWVGYQAYQRSLSTVNSGVSYSGCFTVGRYSVRK